jgi:diazepam-binding inhibitor (GABA receptor modulating acyl-CoA-binding protein)
MHLLYRKEEGGSSRKIFLFCQSYMNSIMVLTWTLLAVLFEVVQSSKDFEECAEYVRTSPPRTMKESDKLKVYGLYKQGTSGDCEPNPPRSSNNVEKAKRTAWCSEKGKTLDAARAEYVSLMDKLAPEWRSNQIN